MAKRINVSIPQDDVPLLDDFDDKCKDLGLPRSEVLVELMYRWAYGDTLPDSVKSRQATAKGFGASVIGRPKTKDAQNGLTELLQAALEEGEHASNDPLPEFLK